MPEQSLFPEMPQSVLMEDYLKRHPELNPDKYWELIGGKPTVPPEEPKQNVPAERDVRSALEERDPNGKNPHEPGAKLDSGKPSIYRGLLDYFPRACSAVAEVSTVGAKKYAWKGWETVPDGFSRYSDALGRHILAESSDGSLDKDTGLLHAAHTAWNAMARLELLLKETK